MNMRKTFSIVLLGFLAAGCQSSKTAGEKMIVDAHANAPTPREAATQLATAPTTSLSTQPATLAAPATARVNAQAPGADPATHVRNWNQSIAYYANGNVVAGPLYRIDPAPPATNSSKDVTLNEALRSALVVPQLVATPFWIFVTPPNTAVEYHGDEFPPSYTLTDPLPYYVDEKVPGMVKLTKR